MIESPIVRLQGLAQSDPVVAPLARLQAEALGAAQDAAWERGLPTLESSRLAQRVPLLEDVTLAVDEQRVADLIRHLASPATEGATGEPARGGHGDLPLQRAAGALIANPLDALAASLAQDVARLQRMADDVGVEASLLATLAHLAALPLLQAVGHRAAPLLADVIWQAGYCPTCAAWPALVELRGLERQRWLRCGRCGAGWFSRLYACAYCGNSNHETLGYLAAERERDARRAETCDRCHCYLKAVATLGPLSAAEILVQDATTLELDVAALEQGYRRPEEPGFALHVHLEPAGRGRGWAPWRR